MSLAFPRIYLFDIPDYAPIIQVLHGGVILSLTDTMGSLAIATKGQWMTGVSTDISASFVKPGGKLGDKVLIEGRVVGIGALFYSGRFAILWDRGWLPQQITPSKQYHKGIFLKTCDLSHHSS